MKRSKIREIIRDVLMEKFDSLSREEKLKSLMLDIAIENRTRYTIEGEPFKPVKSPY